MEWLKQLNEALEYLEANIEKEISYSEMAKIACCSTYHFQRMFSYIAGIPLGGYIRRRKMTLAALDLQRGEKVIDVGLKYGYDSPTAFNRAFKSVHGITPSSVKGKDNLIKAYPRITFSITIKGDVSMNYKIVEKDAFRIVGVKKKFTMNVEESFAQVPLFWQETANNGMIPKIAQLIDQEPYGVLGVSTCGGIDYTSIKADDEFEFDYYIATTTDSPPPEGMSEYTIKKCTWAIFECIGAMPNAIQELQKRIVAEWLPTSGYEYANAPDIEVYFDGDQMSEDYRCEVWLPIIKK